MWIQEMKAIEKTAYGFVKLTSADFIKLGMDEKAKTAKCEACRMSADRLTLATLNEKNRSKGKLTAALCTDCKRNNSGGRSILKGWEEE